MALSRYFLEIDYYEKLLASRVNDMKVFLKNFKRYTLKYVFK